MVFSALEVVGLLWIGTAHGLQDPSVFVACVGIVRGNGFVREVEIAREAETVKG